MSSTPPDDQMLCYCRGKTYGDVRRAIEEIDAKNVDQVTAFNTAGGGCRTCQPEIQDLIDEHRGRKKSGGLLGLVKRLLSR